MEGLHLRQWLVAVGRWQSEKEVPVGLRKKEAESKGAIRAGLQGSGLILIGKAVWCIYPGMRRSDTINGRIFTCCFA